ncbi:hypothetical protein AZH47_12530 [Corynebacterium striatum]|nr:hypothetical protein AZH47_12530 [Corynebacterium striatum]
MDSEGVFKSAPLENQTLRSRLKSLSMKLSATWRSGVLGLGFQVWAFARRRRNAKQQRHDGMKHAPRDTAWPDIQRAQQHDECRKQRSPGKTF